MKEILEFVGIVSEELAELYHYASGAYQLENEVREEFEKQLMARLVRKASDAQMRRELRNL